MHIDAAPWSTCAGEYTGMIDQACARPWPCRCPPVVEFELLPDLTLEPEWAPSDRAAAPDADRYAASDGLANACGDANDIREFVRPRYCAKVTSGPDGLQLRTVRAAAPTCCR